MKNALSRILSVITLLWAVGSSCQAQTIAPNQVVTLYSSGQTNQFYQLLPTGKLATNFYQVPLAQTFMITELSMWPNLNHPANLLVDNDNYCPDWIGMIVEKTNTVTVLPFNAPVFLAANLCMIMPVPVQGGAELMHEGVYTGLIVRGYLSR